ncbi:selenium cofactor biosynthesis protein YqeC, partial [Chloroflexota bacterium]
LLQNLDRYGHVTLARERLPEGKLAGVSEELAVELAQMKQISYIIVEADGAAGRPLKAPNDTEPVIPCNTSLVIPVVGIDIVSCRLTEEKVFRPNIASKLLGLPPGEIISVEDIARLLTHPQGIIKGSPTQARIIPFLNKMDLDTGLLKGRDLAARILATKHHQIERVVLGQTQSTEPAVEVILRH